MKLTNKIIGYVLTAVLLIGSNCAHHPGVSEQDVQLTRLSSTWKVKSATLDNVNQDGYASMTVTLSGTPKASNFNYAVSGRPQNSPWPVAGSWAFGSTVTSQLVRDKGTADELPMTYTVNDTELELRFQFNGAGYAGRFSAVEGQWTFKFVK